MCASILPVDDGMKLRMEAIIDRRSLLSPSSEVRVAGWVKELRLVGRYSSHVKGDHTIPKYHMPNGRHPLLGALNVS